MRLITHTFGVVLSCAAALILGSAAFGAEENPHSQAPGAAGEQAAQAAKMSTPKETCDGLVEAAKKDDFNSFMKLTLGMEHGMHHSKKGGQAGEAGGKNFEKSPKGMKKHRAKMEQGFHKMHKEHLAMLKELSCGTEKITGDHAFVETEGKDQKRLIPFIQKEGKWYFDARTYMSFYRESLRENMKQEKKAS